VPVFREEKRPQEDGSKKENRRKGDSIRVWGRERRLGKFPNHHRTKVIAIMMVLLRTRIVFDYLPQNKEKRGTQQKGKVQERQREACGGEIARNPCALKREDASRKKA